MVWIIDLATQLVIVQTAHKNLEDADVPAGLEGFHATLVDATGDCSEMTEHLSVGIDNQNETEIEIASVLLTSCSKKITDIGERMNAALGE